jgi:hypothetical protein
MEQPTISVGEAKYKVGERVRFDRQGHTWTGSITRVDAKGNKIFYYVRSGAFGAVVPENEIKLVENGGKRKTRRRRRGKTLRRRRRV